MSDKNEIRDIPALSMRAALGSANAEKRTVEVVWTTGARVLRSSWLDGQFYEELSLDPRHVRLGRLNNGAPFLADHDGARVAGAIGVVESATIDGKQGLALVRFDTAENDPEADKIFRKIQNGIVRNVSVGYRIHAFEKMDNEEIPTFRAVDWEPFEISAVAMGADDGAGFRSAEEKPNPCTFTTRGSPQPEEIMDPKPEIEVVAAPVDETRALELKTAAVTAERARAAGIRAAVKAANLSEDVAEKLVNDGVELEAARAVVLEKLAERSESIKTESHLSIKITDDAQDKFIRGVSAWMFEKSGNGVVKAAKQRGVEEFKNVELDGGEFRGMSAVDIARETLERRGVSLRGVYGKEEIIKRALATRGGYASTSDFAVLFENVMHKQMRAAFAVQDHTWRRFCGTDTVSDFRSANRFLNGSFGTLSVIAEGGEYQNVAIPDGAKTSISTETRGAKISISRQALINDDMGALSDLAVRFGLMAGRSIDSAVYAMLGLNSGLGPTMSDSQPFFHSNRANVSTSAALSVAALDADRVKMRDQRDVSSNDYLDLNPSILLVPVGLDMAAKVINSSPFNHDSTKLQQPNGVQGMFSDIVSSPRLSWSTTRRYLFTAGREAFKVVFLEGTGEGPVMDSQEDFDTDGLSWKARIDFKVNPYDPKTALTNTGT